MVAQLNGYVNLVAWLNGMVVGLLCGLMMVAGWLDDGGCVGCVGAGREMIVGKK